MCIYMYIYVYMPYFLAWGAPFAIAIHRDLESCPGFDIVIHTDQGGLFPRP